MSLENAVRMMQNIDQIEELTILIDARASARRIYGELQTMHAATGNPLYRDYMSIVAKAGESLNADIEKWGRNQRLKYASADDDTANDGSVDRE